MTLTLISVAFGGFGIGYAIATHNFSKDFNSLANILNRAIDIVENIHVRN